MAKVNGCPNAEERDLALRYLAGSLPEDEAEAFEAHYFECVSCWEDVQRGSELRAALGRSPIVTSHGAGFRWADWASFATAAAVVFAMVATWQAVRVTPEPSRPVYRGAATEMLAVETAIDTGGRLRLSWTGHSDAQSYRIEVLSSDGVSLLKRETDQTILTLDPASFSHRPGVSFLAKVEALDSMGEVVARSGLTSLPLR